MTRQTAAGLILGLGIMPAQERPFRVQTRVVQVPVSVTDKSGRNVDGLRSRDFKVLDNGVPREAASDEFSALSAPISLVIAIQTSGIPAPVVLKIRRIGGMIQPLVIGRRGEAAVVTFDSEIKWLQDFTQSDASIRSAVNTLKQGSRIKDRMLDAIAEAADRLKLRPGRKVLLLVSESRDRGSEINLQHAIETLAREGIEVFGATIPGQTDIIQALTEATGGSDYPFQKEHGIENAIEKFGADVHRQYIISFPPGGSEGRLHSIDVSVPNRADLHIRFRRAYWAEQVTAAP